MSDLLIEVLIFDEGNKINPFLSLMCLMLENNVEWCVKLESL